MVCLAERQRSTGMLTLGAAFALTLVASLRTGSAPAALPPASVCLAEPHDVTPAPQTSDCPAAVRAQLHLASAQDVFCIAGNFMAPGYFVHATYNTTETWERYGIVAGDGHVLLAMNDRPQLREMSWLTADLDGDGRDEIVATASNCGEVSIDIMAIRNDTLAVTSQRIPVDHGSSGCELAGIALVGREIWIRDAIYRLDRGWLVFAGSTRDR